MALAVNVVSEVSSLPSWLAIDFDRITQGFVNCSVRFVSKESLRALPPAKDGSYNAPRNSYEELAAAYYESLGHATVKLDHFITQSIKIPALRTDKIIDHERMLKIALDRDSYERFFRRDSSLESVASLSSVDPTKYPLHCYPPDFVVYRTARSWFRRTSAFFFAEVKGPKDRLHWNQANWFVRLMPADWHYEILAIVKQRMDVIWLFKPNGEASRIGPLWSDKPAT
jgi:hypothetical protein